MSTNTDIQTSARSVQSRILTLLEGLPLESLTLVERFVQFLREQARRGQPVVAVSDQEERPPYRYPTVAVPPSSLDGWLNLVPEGYEGDALADTEALYDEV
jgi:hypothetical protein